MQIKLLKVFCDVATRRSFSRGAKDNELSQSAASQIVSQIEHRLGVKLIDRSKRPLVLTAEGEFFNKECRKVIDGYHALEEKVRTLHTEVSGRVRVASIYSVGLSHMNNSVQQFLASFPKSNVRVEYQHPDQVYKLVEEDRVDVGLVSYPKNSGTWKAIAWRNEPMVIVCSPQHRFAHLESATLRHVHGQPLVAFQEGLRIRQEVDRVLTAAGVEVNVVMQFDNTETIKRAIEIDSGVGILPEPTVAREVTLGTLNAIPLGADSFSRPLGIIMRQGKEQSETTQRFVDFLLSKPMESISRESIVFQDSSQKF